MSSPPPPDPEHGSPDPPAEGSATWVDHMMSCLVPVVVGSILTKGEITFAEPLSVSDRVFRAIVATTDLAVALRQGDENVRQPDGIIGPRNNTPPGGQSLRRDQRLVACLNPLPVNRAHWNRQHPELDICGNSIETCAQNAHAFDAPAEFSGVIGSSESRLSPYDPVSPTLR